MPTFVTMGYGDHAGYDPTDAFVREAAHADNARLREAGVVMGIAGTAVDPSVPKTYFI